MNQQRKALKEKYGVVTMEMAVLERVLPENQLKTIAQMYTGALMKRGKNIKEEDVQQELELVQSLYKKGMNSVEIKKFLKLSDYKLGALLARAMEKGML